MDCRRSLGVFRISLRFSTMISDCSLMIRMDSVVSGSFSLLYSSMNSENASPWRRGGIGRVSVSHRDLIGFRNYN